MLIVNYITFNNFVRCTIVIIMEVLSDNHNSCDVFESNYRKKNEICEVFSNWKINNGKKFFDTISVTSVSKVSNGPSLEEIVSLDACIELHNPKQSDYEPCVVDIKIINGQQISSIALVSEATVLEFFKQCGEYAATIFAEFIDEFQNNSVYMGVVSFNPPTSEASIKFTKLKNKTSLMWLYGIRLILTESAIKDESNMFNPQIINDFLLSLNKSKSKSAEMANKVLQSFNSLDLNSRNEDIDSFLENFIGMGMMSRRQKVKCEKEERKSETKCSKCIDDCTQNSILDIRTYIDNKFVDVEKKLLDRIDLMEQKTIRKLDTIMKILETKLSPT